MNEEFSNNNSIDAELQVRLMNLVMGEVSDFERDQLQLLMEQRAELVAYYHHLEHLHGLLCEVEIDEPSTDVVASNAEQAWRLSVDRRQQVLAVLDGTVQNPQARPTLAISTNNVPRSTWSRWATAGAVVTAASVMLGPMLLHSIQSAKSVARKFDMDSTGGAYYLGDDSNSMGRGGQAGGVTGTVSRFMNDSGRTGGSVAGDKIRVLEDGVSNVGVSGAGGGQARVSSDQTGIDGLARLRDLGRGKGGEVAAETIRGMGTDGRGDRDKASATTNKEGGGLGPGTMDDYSDQSLANGVAEAKYGFVPSIDNFSVQGKFGKDVEVTVNPNEPRFDNWQDRSHRLPVESPKMDIANEYAELYRNANGTTAEIGEADSAPSIVKREAEDSYSVTVPENGTILLGGIERTGREQNLNWHEDVTRIDDLSTLMMTVTPRILIPEEDEEVLKIVAEQKKDMSGNSKLFQQMAPLDGELRVKGELKALGQIASDMKEDSIVKKGMQLEGETGKLEEVAKSDLSKNGWGSTKNPAEESVSEQISRLGESAQSLWEDATIDAADMDIDFYRHDGRVKDLNTKGAHASGDSAGRGVILGWKFTPAPSPEIASRRRGPILLEGKTTTPKQAESLDEQSAAVEAFSTFSLHVSDVSFKLAQTALSQGQWPEAAKIRIEEFVNALDYHDPLPSANQKVACRVEQAIHPFLMQRNLLRVSMRTAATGRSLSTPLRLTLLLDNSGSMERQDRRQAVLRAFQSLTAQLNAADQVTLISFASTPRLLADKVPGNQGETLLQLIQNLPSEGGTNIEAALLLAREKAAEQQLAGAQNRIVLLTDGAVNLGDANPESLAKLVTQLRDNGIAFDAAGISAHDLNDEVLEALTRRGDGRYYLLDSAEAVSEGFAAQIAGALRPSAQNVKVQVEFNPQRVGRYKLLGFEKHRLNKEDFRNDQVDAAEMAAAEAGVGMYQFEIKPHGSGDVGSVSVRFRDLSSGQMVERRWPIPYEPNAPRLEQADASMQLAASAALFAAKLIGGPLADSVDLAQLHKLLSSLSEQCVHQPRVQQLRTMIEQAKAIGQ